MSWVTRCLGVCVATLLACAPRPEATPHQDTTSLPSGFSLRPREADDATARLCSVIATDSRAPVALPGLPLGDTAAPRLAQRVVTDSLVTGVRFVVPGESAAYIFEGFTANGASRISGRVAVASAPGVRVPVGAADSLIEQALMPAPRQLDAELIALRPPANVGGGGGAGAPGGTNSAIPFALGDAHAKPRLADAAPVVRDFPLFEVALSEACPDVTVQVPVLARVDQRIRIPVQAGDVISAHAAAEAGAVRVYFEEAGPPPAGARYTEVPVADIVASRDGRVTLRVELQVVVRKQRADQQVLIHLARRRPH